MFAGGCRSWNLPLWQCAQPIATVTLPRSQHWDFAAVQRSPDTIANDFCSPSLPLADLDNADPNPLRFSHSSLPEAPSQFTSLRRRWSNAWRLAAVSFVFSLLVPRFLAVCLQGRHMDMAGWGELWLPELMIRSAASSSHWLYLLYRNCISHLLSW